MLPLKVGLTGGIGTGKSTVALVFETMGIPVLNADTVAKYLMNTDAQLIKILTDTFGSTIYQEGKLQNKILGAIVFNDDLKLKQLNSIVHPATIAYSSRWMQQQSTPYAIKEAAILIESLSYKDMDLIIGVDADMETRISRTMFRDHIDRDAVLQRMAKQMDNREKMKYCDYVIINDEGHSLIEQCLHIHKDILSKAQHKHI